MAEPVYVTRPFLPPIEEFAAGLGEIWDSRWLTNNGPLLQRFTGRLSRYLETDNVCLFNNGTLALQLGLQGLKISGEVITTPFTFVATTHALYWNKLEPVFVDIEPDYYTLDPEKVEAAITPRTSAILAVHVFGYPCKLKELADVARRHGVKLVYDAAHAFGVEVDGRSIAHYGDMSMFSFHATKLYHSIEGGMLTFQDAGLKQKLDYLRNFGFKNEVKVVMPGTNAKMNEMQALMGMLVLKHLDELVEKGRATEKVYRERLADVPGIRIPPPLPAGIRYNYGYMPIEVDEAEFGMNRDRLYRELKRLNVHARRYFYPLVPDFECYRDVRTGDPLVVARRVAGRILTLPTYHELPDETVERICRYIGELQTTAVSET
ncbi:DegT/DnrJ/EryC1/StrS family aminotransferase [candidate division WOR-3 bacterium]|nr:DegT/DnrJ/EryC1/StrS family aminotransferase [candidate division WOR-3 bacterium]